MKPIPTPREYTHSGESRPLTGLREIRMNISETGETVKLGLAMLRDALPVTPDGAVLTLVFSDDAWFAARNAAEQGYILTHDGGTLTLAARQPMGFFYGLMTLLQLAEDMPETFVIRDRPEIRWRGVMNTLWAESGIMSYDFGDGLPAMEKRLSVLLDTCARYKLNLVYADAFGFRHERFPGYDAFMKRFTDLAKIRGVRVMAGGYGMGYGQSGHGQNVFMGKVFRNRDPYPDGELYDCIGTYDPPNPDIRGRSYGTCLSNNALTDDKIDEMRQYLLATGVNTLYLHNMDSDEIHEPLWLARCERCRKRYPNDSLYAEDGCAGAFAAFYDRLLTGLRKSVPDVLICPVSPGYAYAVRSTDRTFEKCRRFWGAVMRYMKCRDGVIPLFRELFHNHDDNRLRYDMLDESIPSGFGSVFFSGGDGFYSDKYFVPSAVITKTMERAELIVCANGSALQRPTQLMNAEYLWNPDGSAFYNADIPDNYTDFMAFYNAILATTHRPEGLYGELLETACRRLWGDTDGAVLAEVYRIHGARYECPVFTVCSVELYTRRTRVTFPVRWDDPSAEEQLPQMRARYAETVTLNTAARSRLFGVTAPDAEFLREGLAVVSELCQLMVRYIDAYRMAAEWFTAGVPLEGGFRESVRAIVDDAEAYRKRLAESGRTAVDPLGGAIARRDELFDLIAYNAGLILQSIETNLRIPENRRPDVTRQWW